MRRTLILLAMAAAIFAFQGTPPHPAQAITTTWDLRLTGLQENPPVLDDAAWATAQLSFDDATRTVTYTINVFGVAPELVTAAHIHFIGAVGVNTNPKYPLLAKGMLNASGKVTIDASDVPALLAGDMYVNMHTLDHPLGAARAQIEPLIKTLYRMEVNALNKFDVASRMAFYADNAQQYGGGLCGGATPCLGKAAIQRQVENAASPGARVTLTTIDFQISGNTLTTVDEIRTNATRTAGIDRFLQTTVTTYAGGLIIRRDIANVLTDPKTQEFIAFQAAQQAAQAGAPIRPPATGDAGLASGNGSSLLLPVLALTMLSLGGTAAVAYARRRV